MTAGIDRRTGRPLEGWPHVLQSMHVIFTTGFGARIMRRTFGSAIPRVLGKNLVPSTMLKFFVAYTIAVELWEPRFRVRKFSYPEKTNSPDRMRQGQIGIAIDGDYLPGALEGDFSVAIPQQVSI